MVINKLFLAAEYLGLIDRGQMHWRTMRTEVALLTIGEVGVACVPGEIYPEVVNGGIERAPGGDFDIAPVEVPPLRELMPGRIKFVFGLANDELGYIIPKSEWNKSRRTFTAPRALFMARSTPVGRRPRRCCIPPWLNSAGKRIPVDSRKRLPRQRYCP